jgi:hypothetical protein
MPRERFSIAIALLRRLLGCRTSNSCAMVGLAVAVGRVPFVDALLLPFLYLFAHLRPPSTFKTS